MERIRKLEKETRENLEADEKFKALREDKDALEEEFEIVRKRLEGYDPLFKWENEIFLKIATVLKRVNISPLQAFKAFDEDDSGTLDKAEFHDALENKLKIYDLTIKERDILW